MKPGTDGDGAHDFPEDLDIYLDGLDASTDGRGWGLRHQEAFERLSRKLGEFHKLLAALQFARGIMESCNRHEAALKIIDKVIAKAEGKPCKP